MAERGDYAPAETPLPGLDSPEAVDVGQGEVEKAARRSLHHLHVDGHVTGHHAVMMAALVTTARQLDRAATSGKAKDYGVAALVAQLREVFVVLAPKDEGGETDPFAEFQARLADEQRRAAAVRDEP